MTVADPLWPEFSPLWAALRAANPPPLLAGGYGLFLKQNWSMETGSASAVPLPRWRTIAPRTTKDVDIIVRLEVIADQEQMALVRQALRSHGFDDREDGWKRWKYIKQLPGGQAIFVELHAPTPHENDPSVQVKNIRVRNRQGNGEDRIHGRHNPEAVGCHLHGFPFNWQGVSVDVPNPLTWAIMKITAAAERHALSQDPDQSIDERDFQRKQAEKHAIDAGRIVALMTAGERGNIAAIRSAVSGEDAYVQACLHRDALFGASGFMIPALQGYWNDEDVGLIMGQLAAWFP